MTLPWVRMGPRHARDPTNDISILMNTLELEVAGDDPSKARVLEKSSGIALTGFIAKKEAQAFIDERQKAGNEPAKKAAKAQASEKTAPESGQP
jgi:hypothetical protein